MKRHVIAVVLWIGLAGVIFSRQGHDSTAEQKETYVADAAKETRAQALALARSANPSDHHSLQNQLESQEFLERLDSPEAYRETGRRLNISRVLDALASNPAQTAKSVLVKLTESAEFLKEPRRIDDLIVYTAGVRPPPPSLIAFWDKYCQPMDGYSNLTIGTLTKNGTEQSLALLERKLADPSQPDDDKLYWMRSLMLPHRNEVPLLVAVERMLRGSLPQHLRPELVEAIFDYQPDQWYPEAAVIKPPNRLAASSAAKEVMRRIGRLALDTVTLTPTQKSSVKKALLEIETQQGEVLH